MSIRSPQALLLAHHSEGSEPLALQRTGGISNLKRVLLTLRRKGVNRFFIFGGRHQAVLQAALAQDSQTSDLTVIWVPHPDEDDQLNSIRSAISSLPGGNFFLVSVDRIFSPEILEKLLSGPSEGLTLAIEKADKALNHTGLGIRLDSDEQVTRIERKGADATWSGLALCNGRFLHSIERLKETESHMDLVDIFNHMADENKVNSVDISGCYWQEIHGPENRRKANKILLNSLRKPQVDGVVARHINRHFSLFLSGLLMNTSIRPNHITFITMLVALAGGVFGAMATADSVWYLGLAGFMWQLASMLDGTDGELARMKFQTSKYGEWFDTISDDMGRFAIFLGTGYGISSVLGNPIWFELSMATVALQILMTIRFYTLMRQVGSGSHLALAWTSDRDEGQKDTAIVRFWKRIEFMSRRDYYILVYMVILMTGLYTAGVVLNLVTTSIVLGHEIVRPRQPRDRNITAAILARND